MTWAFRLDLKPATAKFVLVAIADNADDVGRAFPSVDALVAKTSLDRKTVIHSLDVLERRQLLRDSGERVGRTRQVKVYVLLMKDPESGTVDTTPERVPDLPKDSVDGTVERVPKIPPNSTVSPAKGTVFPPKGSQKRDTESSGNHQKEPSGNRQSPAQARRPTRRAPPDFEVSAEMREWAQRETPGVDIVRQTARFRDYEFRATHSDWPATWRNWMRKAAEGGSARGPPGRESISDTISRLHREADEAGEPRL